MREGLGLHGKPTRATLLIFLLLSCVGMAAVFRGALWGAAILAPLDIAPALYSKYKWIDPKAGPIPRNHYLIDMFDYDVPRNFIAHQSLANNEFPWWEPYSEGGRPLAAEPHFAINDPLRLLLLRCLPFVSAYNWARLLQSFFAGLSMFLLLRSLKFSGFSTLLGALSFQFSPPEAALYYTASAHSLFYYPLLWLVLHSYSRTRPAVAVGLGGLLCAAIVMAGTQQSHVYLVLFLGCFLVGYGSCFRAQKLKLFAVTAGAFLLGCALTAPLLMAHVELFALGNRSVPRAGFGLYMLTGLFSITGVFPWFSGSFRTLDVGKFFGQSAAAYTVYLGTAAMIFAVVGLLSWRRRSSTDRPEIRTGVLLVVLYFVVICSTPLLKVLYIRSSGLAVLGLTVLFAAGCEVVSQNAWPDASKVIRWMVLLLGVGIIFTHIFAFAIYPRLKDRVLQVVLEKDRASLSMPSAPELRRFQVDNLPNEITFKNPEPLLAFLSAVCLLGIGSLNPQWRRLSVAGVFALNLLPLVMFAQRAIPYSPVRYWNALISGGPEQRRLINVLHPDLRLDEQVPGRLDHAFPGMLPAIYGVHSLHGYSSLFLAGPGQMGSPREANVRYVSAPGEKTGDITVLHTNQVRFVWAGRQQRDVRIVRETPNSIRLAIGPGSVDELIRTDTYYPGWHVASPKGIAQGRNRDGFSTFRIPSEAIELTLRYRPSYFRVMQMVSLTGIVITGIFLFYGIRRLRSASSTQPVSALSAREINGESR